MGGFRTVILVPVLLGACAAPEVNDLAENERLYKSPGFRAPQSAGLAIFINPLQDKRKLPDFSKSDNIYAPMPEGHWQRPVTVMVEEVLRREIEGSGIYTGISAGEGGQPRPGDCVLDAELLEFYRVHETQVAAGQTGYTRMGAAVTLKLTVHGPVGADGKRPVRLSKVFKGAPSSRFGLNVFDQGISLSGAALQQVMREAMPVVYASNRATTGTQPGTADAGHKR